MRPAWPGWLAALVGAVLLFGTVGAAAVDARRGRIPSAPELLVLLAAVGALLLLGGLAWFALRALERRSALPAYRYRGPSILLLIGVVLALGQAATLLAGFAALASGVEPDTLQGPIGLSALVAVTPLAFLAVSAVFVLRPGALAGMPLADGPRTLVNVLRGVALAIPTWLAAGLVGLAVALLLERALGIQPPDEQVVVGILREIPAPIALVLAAGLVPIAEELFFRGIAFNAWEREYGTSRAIVGSALLFAGLHALDGAWAALPPLFVIGLVLAIVYARSRSLPMAVGVHVGFNAISLVAVFAGVE